MARSGGRGSGGSARRAAALSTGWLTGVHRLLLLNTLLLTCLLKSFLLISIAHPYLAHGNTLGALGDSSGQGDLNDHGSLGSGGGSGSDTGRLALLTSLNGLSGSTSGLALLEAVDWSSSSWCHLQICLDHFMIFSPGKSVGTGYCKCSGTAGQFVEEHSSVGIETGTGACRESHQE